MHAPDRLARRYAYQVLFIEEFRRAAVDVVFLNRPIGGSAEDDLLLQVQGVIAEYERARILERSRRGRRHAARSGAVSAMCSAPFGYRYVDRHTGGRAVPQFLADLDVAAHCLPARMLRWTLTGWMGGDPATGPTPLSAFAALDGLIGFIRQRLGIRRVVLAGHSGGGQVMQRYAILGDPPGGLRFVVANPSSYAFLGPERPRPSCRGHDDWKYGLSALPDYAGVTTRDDLARRYAERDVHYLLGAHDTDPAHPALDRSAAAQCQGPHRRARGEAFHADLLRRFPGCRHTLRIVPGVGHDGGAILGSAERATALFD